MNIERHTKVLFAVAGLGVASVAQAHPGHGVPGGFGSGFVHPFTGLDHILAMLAVGLWAAQQGGRARWGLPLAFVGMMVAGSLLALGGATLPAIEPMIAVSVLALGFLVSLSARVPLAAGALLVGAFGMWHGYAHGLELRGDVSAAGFIAGFALATATLHAIGLSAGTLLNTRLHRVLRVGGAAIGVVGALLLVGL